MSRALNYLDRILFVAIGLILGAMVLDVTIQVVFRYIVQDPPVWTEEAARYLLAWDVFLAMGLAFGRGSHIVVDALMMVLPKIGKRVLAIFGNVLVLVFLFLLLRYGITMVQLTSNTTSTGLGLNIGVVYASLPTGAAISMLYVLVRLWDLIRGDDRSLGSEAMMVD